MDTYDLPQEFKQLIGTVQQVRKRVLKEIESLPDNKSAVKFKIRTLKTDKLINTKKK